MGEHGKLPAGLQSSQDPRPKSLDRSDLHHADSSAMGSLRHLGVIAVSALRIVETCLSAWQIIDDEAQKILCTFASTSGDTNYRAGWLTPASSNCMRADLRRARKSGAKQREVEQEHEKAANTYLQAPCTRTSGLGAERRSPGGKAEDTAGSEETQLAEDRGEDLEILQAHWGIKAP